MSIPKLSLASVAATQYQPPFTDINTQKKWTLEELFKTSSDSVTYYLTCCLRYSERDRMKNIFIRALREQEARLNEEHTAVLKKYEETLGNLTHENKIRLLIGREKELLESECKKYYSIATAVPFPLKQEDGSFTQDRWRLAFFYNKHSSTATTAEMKKQFEQLKEKYDEETNQIDDFKLIQTELNATTDACNRTAIGRYAKFGLGKIKELAMSILTKYIVPKKYSGYIKERQEYERIKKALEDRTLTIEHIHTLFYDTLLDFYAVLQFARGTVLASSGKQQDEISKIMNSFRVSPLEDINKQLEETILNPKDMMQLPQKSKNASNYEQLLITVPFEPYIFRCKSLIKLLKAEANYDKDIALLAEQLEDTMLESESIQHNTPRYEQATCVRHIQGLIENIKLTVKVIEYFIFSLKQQS